MFDTKFAILLNQSGKLIICTARSLAGKSKLTSPKASRREPLSTRLAEKPLGEDAVALENAVSGQTSREVVKLVL